MAKQLKFIKVDTEYIEFLRKYDTKVQINSEEMQKDTKPFFGILFSIDDLEYFVPLSSGQKSKYGKMYDLFIKTKKRPIDMIFVTEKEKDGTNRLLSVLNLNNMIPIPENAKIEFDIDVDQNALLLRAEYIFCKDNANEIISTAKRIYHAVITKTWDSLQKRSCDFKLLEEKCKEYKSKK